MTLRRVQIAAYLAFVVGMFVVGCIAYGPLNALAAVVGGLLGGCVVNVPKR